MTRSTNLSICYYWLLCRLQTTPLLSLAPSLLMTSDDDMVAMTTRMGASARDDIKERKKERNWLFVLSVTHLSSCLSVQQHVPPVLASLCLSTCLSLCLSVFVSVYGSAGEFISHRPTALFDSQSENHYKPLHTRDLSVCLSVCLPPLWGLASISLGVKRARQLWTLATGCWEAHNEV